MKKVIDAIIKKFYPSKTSVLIGDSFVESQKIIKTDIIIEKLQQIEPLPLGQSVYFLDYKNEILQGKITGFEIKSHFNDVELMYLISRDNSCFTSTINQKAVAETLDGLFDKIKSNSLLPIIQ
jgi:hypothetical protein